MPDEVIDELKAIIGKLQQLGERLVQERLGYKRTNARLNYRIPLEYSIYPVSLSGNQSTIDNTYTEKSVIKDISASGLLFEVFTPLPIAAILKLNPYPPYRTQIFADNRR